MHHHLHSLHLWLYQWEPLPSYNNPAYFLLSCLPLFYMLVQLIKLLKRAEVLNKETHLLYYIPLHFPYNFNKEYFKDANL
jgi:hypothetical protein